MRQKEKGYLWSSFKIGWKECNGCKESEVCLKSLIRVGRGGDLTIIVLLHTSINTEPHNHLLEALVGGPGWNWCQTLNHHHRVSSTWVVFGAIPFKHCLSLSSSWELTRPEPGVLWLEATLALQWSKTEVKFSRKRLKCWAGCCMKSVFLWERRTRVYAKMKTEMAQSFSKLPK